MRSMLGLRRVGDLRLGLDDLLRRAPRVGDGDRDMFVEIVDTESEDDETDLVRLGGGE